MLSYTNDENPMPEGDRDSRLAPFASCVEKLLKGVPVGYSFNPMANRYGLLMADLARKHEKYIDKSYSDEETHLDALLKVFIQSSELGNYMIFGDPAVSLTDDTKPR